MIKVPRFSKDEIEANAQKFRRKYWKDQKEPIDIDRIVEIDLRMNIDPVKNLLNDLEIDAFISKDLRTITIDYDIYDLPRNENRRRLSISHEVGHLSLHFEIYKQITFESPEDWRDFIESIPAEEYGLFEYQAYEFAGRLLLPKNDLITAIETERSTIESKNLISKVSDLDSVIDYATHKLARSFKVSKSVVDKRIKSEKLDLNSLLGLN